MDMTRSGWTSRVPPARRGPVHPSAPRNGGRRLHPPISSTVPDWTREALRGWWDPARRLLRTMRKYQSATGFLAAPRRRWWVLHHALWSVITQAEIPLGTRIDGGLTLPHPNGIVIHPKARIGPNCLIFQQVTIGTRAGKPGAPTIGGHVDIGAGARILGPVHIGDHAAIGANAVVLEDVPAHATVAGIPARLLRTRAGEPAPLPGADAPAIARAPPCEEARVPR